MPQEPNVLARSGLPLFFELENPRDVGSASPETRMGGSLRTWVLSLSAFQKEALVASSRTGRVWRPASDEGPCLDGHDAAPCPLAFLSVGMIASYMNEITALAKLQRAVIPKIELTQDNFYTMIGLMPKRTMVGGALPAELRVKIDCDLDEAALTQFPMNAAPASPLSGLMCGQLVCPLGRWQRRSEFRPGGRDRARRRPRLGRCRQAFLRVLQGRCPVSAESSKLPRSRDCQVEKSGTSSRVSSRQGPIAPRFPPELRIAGRIRIRPLERSPANKDRPEGADDFRMTLRRTNYPEIHRAFPDPRSQLPSIRMR